MTITDTIRSVFTRAAPPPTTAEETPVLRRQIGMTGGDSLFGGSGRDRIERVKFNRKMYREDPRAKAAIKALARDVTKGGFQIETDDPRVAEVLGAARDRLDLNGVLENWCRLAFRDGDLMLELAMSAERRIESVTSKPCLDIHRNSNDRDTFDDPDRAFWMHPRAAGMNYGKPPDDAIWFAEWQIVHARWDHDLDERYGRPLLDASASAWNRLREGEKDIAVRRKTRSGLKYLHKLTGADKEQIEAYKAINQAALASPFAAVADLYMSEGDVKAIQGDANLSDIDDVLHHVHTWWLSSPVPQAVLGYGQDINYSVVQHQKEQYDESIGAVQRWVVSQILRPIFDRQLLLAGILPEQVKYQIEWPTKKVITPQDIESIARAAAQFRVLGVSDEVIATLIARYLPNIDPDMVILRAMGVPEEATQQRMDAIEQTLRQVLHHE